MPLNDDFRFPLAARGPSTLCNGDEYTNLYGWHMGSIGGGPRKLIGWKPQIHHGNDGHDSTAPHEATGAALAALQSAAAQGLVPFAQAMLAEFGSTWWTTQGASAYAVDLRADLLAMP